MSFLSRFQFSSSLPSLSSISDAEENSPFVDVDSDEVREERDHPEEKCIDAVELASCMYVVLFMDHNPRQFFTIDVKETSTIGDVKKMIWCLENILPWEQKIFFKGTEIDDNEKNIWSFGLKQSGIVKDFSNKLCLRVADINIHVNDKNGWHLPNAISLVINKSSRVFEIKKEIEKKHQIPAKNQKLCLRNKNIKDDWSLGLSGIKDGDTVCLHVSSDGFIPLIVSQKLMEMNKTLSIVLISVLSAVVFVVN